MLDLKTFLTSKIIKMLPSISLGKYVRGRNVSNCVHLKHIKVVFVIKDKFLYKEYN